MIPLCLDQGVAVVPYSPLARGLLAGSRGDDGEPRTVRARSDPYQDDFYAQPGGTAVIGAVAEVARERRVPPAQVALAWLLGQRAVTAPVIGVTRASQLDDAVAAARLDLSPEEIERLEAPYVSRWLERGDEREVHAVP